MLHLPLPGEQLETPASKDFLFRKVTVVCRALAAVALVIVTDAWTLRNEETGTLGTSDAGATYLMEHGTVAASQAGFGQLVEIIMVNGQTKDKVVMKSVAYERHFKGGLLSPNGRNPLGVPHTIQFPTTGVTVIRCPQDNLPGRSRSLVLYEGPYDNPFSPAQAQQ